MAMLPLGALEPGYNCRGWLNTANGAAPLPMFCGCGQPSTYGRDDRWYCLACWIGSNLWRTQ